MTDQATCPTCGKPLPVDAAGGACPRCLLEAGFATGGGAAAPADAAPTPDELAPEFPGLEIRELLGRGGMGVVYRARHRALDREVALKILPPRADAAFAERFQREARALAKLQHPNIVGVHDFGRTAGGTFWLVMEYVDGTNLRQAMRSGALGPKEALAVVPQICDALQYAHEHGVVHRDIKPENVLLDRAGRVKVADFGLAKLMEETPANPALTGAGQVMGTVHYMAPEQWERPKDVDHRADIYSLGVVFYEMLTGELPLGRFEPPSHKVEVDVRLDEVVLRSLAKEPDRRYQRADEVKTDVGRATTPPDAEARRDDETAPESTARVVANEDGVTVHVEKDGRTKRVTVGRHGVRVDRGADKAVHVRWPTWARWAIAAGLLLLCGGPLALFSFFLVGDEKPPAGQPRETATLEAPPAVVERAQRIGDVFGAGIGSPPWMARGPYVEVRGLPALYTAAHEAGVVVNEPTNGWIHFPGRGVFVAKSVAGNVRANGYFAAVIDGDLTGAITADESAFVWVSGNATGSMTLKTPSNVVVEGNLSGRVSSDIISSLLVRGSIKGAFIQLQNDSSLWLETPIDEFEIERLGAMCSDHATCTLNIASSPDLKPGQYDNLYGWKRVMVGGSWWDRIRAAR